MSWQWPWLAVLLSLSSSAQAEICYSNDAQPSTSSIFACPQAGNRTLSQLAQQGYVVRQLAPRQNGSATVWQLILQRNEVIFRSSFEG